MEIVNIIVAGGRDFKDYNLLCNKLDFYLSNLIGHYDICIICGMAKGADSLGLDYAKARGFRYKEMPADWDNLDAIGAVIRTRRDGKKYNAKAGFNRNEDMAKIAQKCVLFWDGRSKGSKHMFDLAKKYNVVTRVVKY